MGRYSMNVPWWHRLRRRLRLAATEPGARLFSRIRLRLTLLYCGVLAGALAVFGVLLYLGVQEMLFSPIRQDLARRADRLSVAWQVAPVRGCNQPKLLPRPVLPAAGSVGSSQAPALTLGVRGPFFAACFGPDGSLGLSTANAPTPFLTDGLALDALRTGSASDQIDGGEGVGTVLRYAVAVPDPSGPGAIGVVQVGEPIEGQTLALHALLKLLTILSGFSLLVAAAAGLLLSGRALAPTRLAFSRQQSFIAAAAHELRTPLTLLRADAEVLLRGKGRLPPEDAELLEDIVAESAHMSNLAANMLTLARLDADQLHLEQEVVDLGATIQRLARRVAALARERTVTLEVQAQGGVRVLGDPLLLEQALLVLIDNAIKYNRPDGTVQLIARQEGDRAVAEVADSGIGIPPEHLPRLGERFFRVDTARARQMGGAGLGLSIAHGIVAQHLGTLALASQPGRGTRATVTLPSATAPRRG